MDYLCKSVELTTLFINLKKTSKVINIVQGCYQRVSEELTKNVSRDSKNTSRVTNSDKTFLLKMLYCCWWSFIIPKNITTNVLYLGKGTLYKIFRKITLSRQRIKKSIHCPIKGFKTNKLISSIFWTNLILLKKKVKIKIISLHTSIIAQVLVIVFTGFFISSLFVYRSLNNIQFV